MVVAHNVIDCAAFDEVKIHGCEGYLIDEFLGRTPKERTRKHGGSLEKRMRGSRWWWLTAGLRLSGAEVALGSSSTSRGGLSPMSTEREAAQQLYGDWASPGRRVVKGDVVVTALPAAVFIQDCQWWSYAITPYHPSRHHSVGWAHPSSEILLKRLELSIINSTLWEDWEAIRNWRWTHRVKTVCGTDRGYVPLARSFSSTAQLSRPKERRSGPPCILRQTRGTSNSHGSFSRRARS
ncbi:hypothetical protein BC826DRAFT_1157625 [Russula brevipes]|nr:hypothetical protein BC826DRAFT_1157625 [Russula brevipes]